MISHISIRDFALIQNISADFEPGLTIVTGETGAGKSILIEAISMALGSRADNSFVRTGCEKAIIQLSADVNGEEYVIQREISAQGKNLCKINGNLVSLGELSSLCRKIADIHGQYDHQSLLNPDSHMDLVDIYGNKEIGPAKDLVRETYGAYREIKQRIDNLKTLAAESNRRRDFMDFELKEIRKANLKEGEDLILEEQINLWQNSEKLFTDLSEAYNLSQEGEPSALSLLKKTADALERAANCTGQGELNRLTVELTDAYYQIEEAVHEIRKIRDSLTFSEEELNQAIKRYDSIEDLKRKYNGEISDLLDYAKTLETKLLQIENIDDEMKTLSLSLAKAKTELEATSATLSALRRVAGTALTNKIEAQLKELNFNNAAISLDFIELKDSKGDNIFTETGTDRAEFMISANKGEPKKPLSRIASGGEMSRIMLAFKKIVADYDAIPTLIFDEIDSGISGIAASVVGKKLKEIGRAHQVICITHLPQIAACGSGHFRIDKENQGDTTITTLTKLNPEERAVEIARLLGGSNVTETTLKSAKELLEASH